LTGQQYLTQRWRDGPLWLLLPSAWSSHHAGVPAARAGQL